MHVAQNPKSKVNIVTLDKEKYEHAVATTRVLKNLQ